MNGLATYLPEGFGLAHAAAILLILALWGFYTPIPGLPVSQPRGTVCRRPTSGLVRTGPGQNGEVVGGPRPTGYLPSFLDGFSVNGLVRPGEPYL